MTFDAFQIEAHFLEAKMAVRKDEDIKALFNDHLEPGEILLHTAFGVKQPHMLLIFGLCLLAIIPGILAIHLSLIHI